MRTKNIIHATMLTLAMLATPLATHAWDRGKVERFATLPPGENFAAGIDVDAEGNVYVATSNGFRPVTAEGTLVVFDRNGKYLRTVTIKGSTRLLLDIDFHPRSGKLLVSDYKAGKVLSVDTKTGDSTVFMAATGKNPGLNSMTFDDAGNVYITDSHQGIIWKTGPDGGPATAWVTTPLLRPTRLPPGVGANGLVFNKKRTALFVANTAQDTIVRIPVSPTMEPGTPEVFVNRVGGGPDGLVVDEHDNLWVACNQANEIVVLEPTQGRVIAKLGDSGGVGPDGAPVGFLWSNSLVFHGDDILVTNFAFDFHQALELLAEELGFPPPKTNLRTVDGPWAQEVKVHTVSKIKRPKLQAFVPPASPR
jgi:sugar lactone lactonase YvrE